MKKLNKDPHCTALFATADLAYTSFPVLFFDQSFEYRCLPCNLYSIFQSIPKERAFQYDWTRSECAYISFQ